MILLPFHLILPVLLVIFFLCTWASLAPDRLAEGNIPRPQFRPSSLIWLLVTGMLMTLIMLQQSHGLWILKNEVFYTSVEMPSPTHYQTYILLSLCYLTCHSSTNFVFTLQPLNLLLFISLLSIFPCTQPVGHSHMVLCTNLCDHICKYKFWYLLHVWELM
jgi:hypothetical protein